MNDARDASTPQPTLWLGERTVGIAAPAPRRDELPTVDARLHAPAAAPDVAADLSRAGRYLIRQRLGRGGMGTVFKAHDPGIGRDVAIKFLHASLCEERESRARFLREARAAGRLSHPNIVTVHDVGEIDGRPYMAMELLDGRPLADELHGGAALPLREALAIGVQLARALDYAHARGIVHRDIKPGNIMRAGGARAIKVTDFGIAHMEPTALEHRTRAGAILGTPEYMSPEQARGERLDGRSDLFSAGVVLYEMLAARRPFGGEGLVAVAMNIVAREPTPLAALRPDLPAALCRVVARCLAKAPAARFASGGELAEALERVQAELDRAEREQARPKVASLGLKSAAAMAVVVAAVMVVAAAFITQRQYAVMVEQRVDGGAAVSRFIAAQNAVSALAEDWVAVDVSVKQVMKTGDFHHITVTDRAGIVRAAGDPALLGRLHRPPQGSPIAQGEGGVAVTRFEADGAKVLAFQAPITFQGVRVGSVALGLTEEPLARVTRLSIGLMALLVVVTVLAVGLAAYFVVNGLARPIEAIAAAMDEIGRGRFEHRLGTPRRKDEFGLLHGAFDRMAQALQDGTAATLAAPGTAAPPAPAAAEAPAATGDGDRPGVTSAT